MKKKKLKNKDKKKTPKAEVEAQPLSISEQIEEVVEQSDEAAIVEAEEAAAAAGADILVTEEALQSEGLASLESPEEELGDDKLPQNLELVQVRSIIESILLAYDKPVNLSILREVFKGTNTPTDLIKRALSDLMVEYAGAERGMSISEVSGGYQLRTKSENQIFVRRLTKGRPFKLSGPSLEVLSIIAYKQPIIKSEVDSIRGVESGHLVRALMDRNLVKFVGKSELPGKPMLYGTTRKFLEIFGLRDLRELPSLSEIDELIPEGMMVEEAEAKEDNWETVQDMSLQFQQDHQKEEEWEKITEEIQKIETTTDFFEQEKQREKERRDQEKAEGIRESLANGQEVSNRDKKWLERYEAQLAAAAAPPPAPVETSEVAVPAAEASPEPTVEAAAEETTLEAVPEPTAEAAVEPVVEAVDPVAEPAMEAVMESIPEPSDDRARVNIASAAAEAASAFGFGGTKEKS